MKRSIKMGKNKMTERMEVRAMSAPWHRGVEFWAHVGSSHVTSMTFEVREDGMEIDPSFKLKMDEAQALMDDLWNCGLRPTEGSGSAGALMATQKHLEDMRSLVFKNKDEVKL
jgi:hypothetical protein